MSFLRSAGFTYSITVVYNRSRGMWGLDALRVDALQPGFTDGHVGLQRGTCISENKMALLVWIGLGCQAFRADPQETVQHGWLSCFGTLPLPMALSTYLLVLGRNKAPWDGCSGLLGMEGCSVYSLNP